MPKTFPIGGVHPPDHKITRHERIRPFPIPALVVIPLSQHIGAPAAPVVAKGDRVLAGQLIGQASGFVSANVHSSVSGTVTSVDTFIDGNGIRKPGITIAVEGDEWMSGIDRSQQVAMRCMLTPREIVSRIAAAGIVGMGGATFPTQVKLMVPEGKKVDMLVINGVECEPYLTSDFRLMLERGREVLCGISILARAFGVGRSVIGIESNKPEAIANLRSMLHEFPNMQVVALAEKYPQGGEKQLIAALTGKRVPSGGLPIDVGIVVQNVATALAVYEAVQKNKSLMERVVTVTGKGLERPANLLVRIGTPVRALLEACGGVPEEGGKVINGGPMMGRAIYRLDTPVTKGTSGILVMPRGDALRGHAGHCIRCARCVQACPMGLEPYLLATLSAKGLCDAMEQGRITDCIECGCCSYTCPANLPLLDRIRLGKAETKKRIRSRKG